MKDIQRAYRVLGVDETATSEAIEEAYSDLRAVWDPGRFPDEAKLQGKARQKLKEIEQAFQLLQSLPTKTPSADLFGEIYRRDQPEKGRVTEEEIDESKGPSLLAEAFSTQQEISRKKWLWLLAPGLILAVALVLIFSESSSEPFIKIAEPRAPEENPSGPDTPPLSDPQQVESESPLEAPAANSDVSGSGQPPEDRPASVAESPPAPLPPASPRPRPRPAPIQRAPAERPALVRDSPQPPSQEAPPVASSTPKTKVPQPETEDQLETSEPEPEPMPDEHSLQAFQTLQEQSNAALRLSGGLIGGLEFRRWTTVQQRANELWLDLIALQADGSEIHFIWSVDSEKGQARALSQAARDLEAQFPR